jgi:hypothetical protein
VRKPFSRRSVFWKSTAQFAGRGAVSASDRIKAELKELESARLQCVDTGIRKVIEDVIVEAKERLERVASQENLE